MLMRQPVSEPGEIWWVFLNGYKWLCPWRPNWFSNIKVMSTYIWLAWMQSWETCTQKWPVICGCNWTTQLEKSIPFLSSCLECWRMLSKPCCPSPSQLSSPRRHPARNKLPWFGICISSCYYTCAYWRTVAPGWIASGPWGTILGVCQPPTSVHSIISMWSVKAVPNLRPSSTGFAFLCFTSCTSTATL